MATLLDVKTKMNYLTAGYVKAEYLKNKGDDENFEMSLITVILQFLGNIFAIFDCYPEGFENVISENGQVFRRKYKSGIETVTIGCSLKWKQGMIHQISFKSNSTAHKNDGIGISTNIEKLCEKAGWYGHRLNDHGDDPFEYAVMKGGHVAFQGTVIKDEACKVGDIITLLFNGNDWTLSFLLNGEIQGKPQKITPDVEYSPFISANAFCSNDTDYAIVYDQTW